MPESKKNISRRDFVFKYIPAVLGGTAMTAFALRPIIDAVSASWIPPESVPLLERISGFKYMFPNNSGFSGGERKQLADQIEQTAAFYQENFGFPTNPNVTSFVSFSVFPYPKGGSDVAASAYYYTPKQLQQYPGGLAILDLDTIRTHRAEGLYEVACEVAHAYAVPDLPLEHLISKPGLVGTTGHEGKDEYLMAELTTCQSSEVCLVNKTAPLYKIITRHPNFFKEMREKWENDGRPEFIPETKWVKWAEGEWEGFSEWWSKSGRNWGS